jgi:molybdopterin/thiamine biosynthesis adenylyltransferase
MRYSITFIEEHFARLTQALFPSPVEKAAYLICGLSIGIEETKLLVREVISVSETEAKSASATHICIPARNYVRWLKRVDEAKGLIVFVHSHPDGKIEFSRQDDEEELFFFRTAHIRIHTIGVHASLLLASPGDVIGRVWHANGESTPFDCIRIIGKRFQFVRNSEQVGSQAAYFDRQIRAFGREFQPILKILRIGIVGLGGTGSSVCEQLIRLGVGTITAIDGENFDNSNINRVYGSYITDAGIAKTQIVQRSANVIGLETKIISVCRPITFKSGIEYLKDCDVIFGCTDDQWGRSLLSRFALFYLTPVIDMGVAVDATPDGEVERVEGRVTILMPGTACLYCRHRISAKGVGDETIQQLDPARAEHLRKEGYLTGIMEPAPSVIPFTTTIASLGITELLHRLTGFMGEDRNTSEIIHRIDYNRVRSNCINSQQDCFCANKDNWGKGDVKPLLGITWRAEQ